MGWYYVSIPKLQLYNVKFTGNIFVRGPVSYHLLAVSSDYAQPITGRVTEAICPVIGRAQPGITLSKRQKTGSDVVYWE